MLKDNHERTDSIDSVISFQFSVIGFQDRLVRLVLWNRWGCARMLYLSHKGAPMVSQSLLAQEFETWNHWNHWNHWNRWNRWKFW